MPLPKPRTLQLVENNFQGLNIEKGVLVRPVNSFTKLENFDLVKSGAIRKVGGNSRLTTSPAAHAIVGFRDYQKVPDVPPVLVVVDSDGLLYLTIFSDPINLTPIDALYAEAAALDEAPFMVSLPFMEYNDETKLYSTVQYVVITVGNKDAPKYFDGTKIYNLGIPNPGDSYTVPFEHSVYIPMLFYSNNLVPNDQTPLILLRGTSPNLEDGINLSVTGGRRYRASWYNPITGHDSSLFPLSLEPAPLENEFSGYQFTPSNTRPAGVVTGTQFAPNIMAIPLFLANLADPTASPLITPPQQGYTHIRFWATRDNNPDYYLVPVIRDNKGKVVSDIRGAVNFVELGLKYGVPGRHDTEPEPLFDGYIPHLRYDLIAFAALGIPIELNHWTQMIPYNYNIAYTVRGSGQTGSSLAVQVAGDISDSNKQASEVGTGFFQIAGDLTIYRIANVTGTAVDEVVWELDKPLAKTPADQDKITLMLVKPTADTDLITSWAETPGPNSDRQNDRPPKASWGTVYQNRLFLVDAEDKTRLVYSRIAHYEDFPPDNVFRFTQGDYDPITAVLSGRQVGLVSEGADSRIVVAKQRTSAYITGTNDTDFAIYSLFTETGIVHKRAAIVIGGFLLAQTRHGLELFEGQRPVFLGSVIKDIIDGTLHQGYGPCFAADRMENQILLGVQIFPADDFEEEDNIPAVVVDTIILMREPRYNPDGSLASPYSTMTIPKTIGVMQESGFGNKVRFLIGASDGHIYQLFTGDTDFEGNPIKATAETQLLPQTDRESRKIFHRIQFEGNEIDNTDWKIQFDMDGNNKWTPVRKMYSETLIGLVGKQLKVRIIHDGIPLFVDTPMLSNFMLEYTPIGEAR